MYVYNQNFHYFQGWKYRDISLTFWVSGLSYRDTEFLSQHKADKSLSRPKPPSMPVNNVATRRSLSRPKARKRCRARMLRSRGHVPIVHACLSSAPRPGHVHGLRTLSQHGRPYQDTRLEKPYRDRGPKIGSSPPAPPAFPFSFLLINPNLNTQ